QLREVHLHGLHRGRGRPLAPELVDQPFGRYELVAMQEQDREQRALLGGADRDLVAVPPDGQRAEEARLPRPTVTPATRNRSPPALPPRCRRFAASESSFPSDRTGRSETRRRT